MADGLANQIVTICIPPLLGLLIWFLSRLISDNEKSHSTFTKDIRAVRNDISELNSELVRLNVVQPKELKDLSKELKSAQHKLSEVERKVDGGRLKTEPTPEGGTKINYGHFPDDGRKVIQVLDVPASVNAKNSAFKVEIIERVERTETQLKTHEMAIGQIAKLSKDNAAKSSGIIVAVKEIQAAVAPDIAVHRAKKGGNQKS